MILYGTQASFAWPRVGLGRFDRFVTAKFGASSLPDSRNLLDSFR